MPLRGQPHDAHRSDLDTPANPEEVQAIARRQFDWVNRTYMILGVASPANLLLLLFTVFEYIPLHQRVIYGAVYTVTALACASGLAVMSRRAAATVDPGSLRRLRLVRLGMIAAFHLVMTGLVSFPLPEDSGQLRIRMYGVLLMLCSFMCLVLPARLEFVVASGALNGATLVQLFLIESPLRWVMASWLFVTLPISLMVHRTMVVRRNSRWLTELRAERVHDELERANDRLARFARSDPLTGMANRHVIAADIEALLSSSEFAGAEIAVLFLDLDRFKVVNDSLGHAAGDELLRVVALRAANVLPANAAAGRLGGDEFVFSFPVIDGESALATADALREAISAPIALQGNEIRVAASIGVALAARDESVEDTMRRADAALYRSKGSGRDRVALFDDDLNEDMARRFEEEQDLRRAIDAGGIEPRYQPEIDLETGRIVGAEALARYQHPTRGLLDAEQLLEVADQVGLVDAVSFTIMESAMRWRASLHEAGRHPELAVRIHVSPTALSLSDFADRVGAMLTETGCPPGAVILEVTQAELIVDIERAAAQLRQVRASGVRVFLDDFGTGHSSIPLLLEVEVDGVKLDRELVGNLDTLEGRLVLQGLAELAERLGATVCADGVETRSQAAALRSAGCPSAHGYLWSPPLSVEAFEASLETSDPGAALSRVAT